MTYAPSPAVPDDYRATAADRSEVELVESLLQRCASREERAFKELYELVAPRLLGVLVRMLKQRAVAEEALQDVMIRIWQRASQYSAYRGRAMSWMIAIARYRAIDLLRTQHVSTPIDSAPDEAMVDAAALDAFDATLSQRLRGALNDCLDRLTDAQRQCLALAYIDGLSQEQIAATVATPLGTVKSWIRRGLTSLKQCLDA